MEGETLERLQLIIDTYTKPAREELKKFENSVKSATSSVDRDTNKIKNSVKSTTSSVDKETNKISRSFKKVGKIIATVLSVAAITAFGKSCIDLGSDLAEVQNVVDVTFGSMSEQINDFAKKSITQFGLSELSAKQYTSTMGAMLKSMGFASDEVFVMSKRLTGLAGDMASFYNLSGDEAFQKIRVGISGETEPLKQLGINMSVANLEAYALSQGITKAYNSMSQTEQAMLRYNYLLSVTADAQGDFARTSDSWANQTKILAESFNSVKAAIGQGLINVFTPVLRVINTLVSKLQVAATAFKNFTTAIFGDAGGGSNAVSEAAADVEGMAGNMSDTAASANATKRALAGFDKLNNISSGSSEGGGAAAIGAIDTSEMTSSVNDSISKVKSDISGLTKWIKNNFGSTFNSILKDGKTNFNNLKTNVKKVWSDILKLKSPLQGWFNIDFAAFSNTLLRVAGDNLNNMFALFNQQFADIWNLAVAPILNNFVTVGLPMVTQFATEVLNSIGLMNDEIYSIAMLLWTEGIDPLLKLFSDTWSECINTLAEFWDKWGQPIFDGINEAISTTADVIKQIWEQWIKPVWDVFMETLDTLWNEHMKPLVSNLLDFVGEFVTAAAEIYNKFIAPIVSYLVDMLAPVFKNTFGDIFKVVGGIIGNIVDSINGILTALKGIIQFVKGIFTGDWKTAWEGIKNIFKGIWDAMVTIVKAPINLIIGFINAMISGVESAINFVISGLNKLSFDVPDWVPVIGGETFGIDIPKVDFKRIQYLAKGGIVNTPTLSIVGEAGKEAVIPLENNTGWMTRMAEVMSKFYNMEGIMKAIYSLGDRIGDGNIYLTATLDGDVVYEAVVERDRQARKRNGNSRYAY